MTVIGSISGDQLQRDFARFRGPVWLIAALCVSLVPPLVAHAREDAALALPLADAPASAYGPDVRPGRGATPNPDDLAGIADRQRRAGHLSTALHLALRVRDYAPGNVQAMQTEVSTLSNLGAAHYAHELALRLDTRINRETADRLRADATAADIRDALAERDRLERLYRYGRRNDPLRTVLPKLDANAAYFVPGSTAAIRTRRDRVLVLRELDRMPEAIAQYEMLKAEDAAPPLYVRRAAADAYLAQRQPAKAAELYAQLVDENPRPPVPLSMAYYYALIESERYGDAADLLARLDRNTPIWRYQTGSNRAQRSPNWERMDVDQLMVLDALYRNHEDQAETLSRRLFENAPRSASLANGYATALRWRGKPAEAARITELATAYAPDAKDTRINRANNARDLEHYDVWAAELAPLQRDFPQDTTVRRSAAELHDRDRPSIVGEASYGNSDGGQAVNGSHDLETRVRMNSPWSDTGWRAYAEHYYRWGDYEGGEARFNRPGIGAEWAWDRKRAWATISDDRFTGDDTGVQVGWSQWLDDHWQYQLMADTYATETPLRAQRENFQGRFYQGQLNWREDESRSASVSAGVLDIADGNTRTIYDADFSQRIQASAHHLTRAVISGNHVHNSQPGGAYYNPENAESTGLTFEHDWLTWRSYERSLTQNFQIGVNAEWQEDYDAAAGFDALYQHSWELSRTWRINYGIGWGSHEYDGNREDRVFGVLGFSGVF